MKGFGIGFIVVLLMGCAHVPSQLADGQIDGYAVGAGLRLNHAIDIPPDSATVRLQFGHVVARNAVQEQEPHCIFELDTVKPEVQVVAPERLRIVSVRRREQTFSGMSVLPSYGGLFRHDDRPSHIYFMTEFRLKSATQPQIRSMTCQHNVATAGVAWMRHLTLAEIRNVLGNAFTLEFGANRHFFEIDPVRLKSGDLAGASANVARASEQQASSGSGMASSMEQLSVSIDQMRKHATDSNDLAVRSGDASREGSAITRSAAQEMAAIADGARQSATIVADLGGLSAEISGIVNVIKEIADQTNLLALNAAIEAARAGEQGRGFAVVADEVRKLAERTSSSTQQIGDMISRIQSGTQRAVQAMESGVSRANEGEELARRAGESIDQIEQRTSEVVRAVKEIQLALSEQSAAAKDVAVRVEQIAQMTETNSSASSQTSNNANQVSGLAGRLNELVAGFRV